VRLEPAEQPAFAWDGLDGPDRDLHLLDPAQVAETQLCTALAIDQRRLATVEHLLAALAGWFEPGDDPGGGP
jgi:UDP-3-O-[3-hydroxymyristoyl] N-acetylglucosamine deacetylase